jgi:succinoglycan biosynthesis protein ExoA
MGDRNTISLKKDGMAEREVLPAPLSSMPLQDRLLFISVVVPVRNEGKFIEKTLKQLLSQNYPPHSFEILVVDGNSTDDTAALTAKIAIADRRVQLLSNPRRLSSAGRNIGIRASRGDAVLVVDGHCQLLDDQLLQKVRAAFDSSNADCLGRPQPLETAGANAFQQAVAAARSSWLGHHPDSFIYSSEERFVPAKSVAAAYRRTVFDKIGLFDENFDACEDVELNHRIDKAGLNCFFTPRIAVSYFPRNNLPGLFRQLFRYGRGRMQLLKKHPETFSPGGFIPGALVAWILLGWLPALAWKPWLILYASSLFAYLLLVISATIGVSSAANKWRLVLIIPLIFLTVHISSGMGIWCGLFSRTEKNNQ